MDPLLIIGLLLAFGSVVAMVFMEGGHLSSLLLPAPIVLVVGATIAVGLASSTWRDILHGVKLLPRTVMGRVPPPAATIERMVGLARTARAEGLLALDATLAETSDRFERTALQGIVDGVPGDELRTILEEEIGTRERADAAGAGFFNSMGGYAPTIGIIGTVVSLTHVLENLSDPSNLGHMIAAAFVATLWGLLTSNFIWLPIGARMERICALETEEMVLVMEGALAILDGSQPALLEDRLRAMVAKHRLPAEAA